MKRLFLLGRSEAGKTSLTQALRGEDLHYHKTQYTNTSALVIDSPGEYAETKKRALGLACFGFEAETHALLVAADEPFPIFEPGCQCFTNRPLIGIITKIDSPLANIPRARLWLTNSGCCKIFEVNNATREGVDKLIEYLQEEPLKMDWKRARERQKHGINEWDDASELGL